MTRSGRFRNLGAADLVFAVVLATGLIGGRAGFFNDPGTYWHLRLGREIAATGSVPRADTFTFTRGGTPWVDQSWAFDLALAAVVDHLGWSGVMALTAVLLAAIYALLTSGLERDGATPLVAGVVGVLAAGLGSMHFLVRPHLVTFACVLAVQRLCRSYHTSGGRSVWLVAPIMVVWANCHGGFLAGPIIVATAVVGHAIDGGLRDRVGRRRLAVLVAVFALAIAAPLINPYGLGLYRHVHGLLSAANVTDLIDEYQPSPFGKSQARVLEMVILALVAMPVFSRARPSAYDVAQSLVWLHFALGSVRHTPLFAFAVAPMLSAWLDGLLMPSQGLKVASARGPGWLSFALGSTVLVLGSLGVPRGGPDPSKWPLDALVSLDRQPTSARLFHEQDWGGLIESECRPRRASYLDDRFELWGREPILEYADALTGGPAWDRVRDRDAIEMVWLKPDRGLSRRLALDPTWVEVHRDRLSVLFRRVGVGTDRAGPSPAITSRVGR
jgi:hypothetical protein